MIKRKFRFKLKKDKGCWCEFFGKLTSVSLKYKSNVYLSIPECNIKENAKDLMAILDILERMYLSKNKVTLSNYEQMKKEISEVDKKLREIELIIEIDGEDEDIVMEKIIVQLIEYLI
ncbi:MAG: hypothetical protein ACP5SD_05780 [Elusimicrobiales bacterium]